MKYVILANWSPGVVICLVMNLALIQAGYPPTVIECVHRRGYYLTLAQADSGNPKPPVNFGWREVERSLILYLEACAAQTEPPSVDEAWIPLQAAAQDTPYSQYLGLLARTG